MRVKMESAYLRCGSPFSGSLAGIEPYWYQTLRGDLRRGYTPMIQQHMWTDRGKRVSKGRREEEELKAEAERKRLDNRTGEEREREKRERERERVGER